MKRIYLFLFLSSFLSANLFAQSPGNIGTTDLHLWLRADAGIATSNQGDPVETWEDQGPLGNHATQTDPAAQPIFNTKPLNENPALYFNNAALFMNVDLSALNDGIYTMFIVAERANGTSNSYLLSTNNSGGNGFSWGLPTETQLELTQFGQTNNITTPAFVSGEAPIVYQCSSTPASGLDNNALIKGNNLNQLTGMTAGTDVNAGLLGRNTQGQGFRGFIAEVIIYDRVLSFNEKRSITNYLCIKYGVTPPAGSNPQITDETFKNDVFAVAKDADSALNQTRSKSQEQSGFLQIRNVNGLENGESLLIGHNGASMTMNNTSLRCGVDFLTDRVWKVFGFGSFNTVKLRYDISSLTGVNPEEIYLLIDTDGNGFQDDPVIKGNLNGNNLTFSAEGIENGVTFVLAAGKTAWVANTSGNSSDPIWSDINGFETNVAHSFCTFSEYQITSGTDVILDQPLLECTSLTVDGTLDFNANEVQVSKLIMVPGAITSTNGTLHMSSEEGSVIAGSSSIEVENLIVNVGVDVKIQAPELRVSNLVDVQAGDLKASERLRLVSNATQTGMIGPLLNGAQVSGKVIVERYHNAGADGYVMVSTPVKSQEITDLNDHFITTGFVGSDYPEYPFYNINIYNEGANGTRDEGFVGVNGLGQNLQKGRGYMIYIVEGDHLMDLSGEIWHGDVDLPVSYTDHGMPEEDGWNLVGNPYASTINWDDANMMKTNLDDAIYVYDASLQTYTSYVNGMGNNGGNAEIAPFQSFWVKANATNPALVVTEASKSTAQSTFKNNDATPMRIAVSNGGSQDECTFYWTEQATENFDPSLEAEKIWGFANIAIASKMTNTDYSILALNPEMDEMMIPLEIRSNAVQSIQVSFESWAGQNQGRCLQFYDSQEDAYYPMDETIALDLEDMDYADRFFIIGSESIVDEITQPTCFMANDGSISVYGDHLNSIEWYNNAEELIMSSVVSESTLANLAPGIYRIATTSEGHCPNISMYVTLESPAPIELQEATVLPSCSDSNDGSILLTAEEMESYSFQWSNGMTSAALEGLSIGDYHVTITDENGCEKEMEFNMIPEFDPHANFDVESFHNLQGGLAVVPFTNQSSDSESFIWNFGDGSINNEENPTHVFSEAGIYSVSLTATSGTCTDVKTRDIMIQVPQNIEGDDSMKIDASFTENGVQIWSDQQWNIQIYNALGQLLHESELKNGEIIQIPEYMRHVLIECQQKNHPARRVFNLAR